MSEIHASRSESSFGTRSKPTGPLSKPKKMKRVIDGMPSGERILPKVCPAMQTVQKRPKVISIVTVHGPMQSSVQHR